MENKTRSRVMLAITLFSAIVLSGTVFVCARRAGEEVTQRSFDELTTATKQLAKDINNATRTDQTILSAMAELIAGQDEDDLDSVLRIMNTFSLDKTFVSTVALLRPDGTLLLTDGARYDVSGAFDFETEAARGAYISDRVTSYFAPEKLVVRNVAPVKRDGETIAILYGMVPLQELSRSYKTDLYGGNAFVLIVDGNTGDILMDTWHDTLGNLSDLSGRKMLKGYTYEEAMEKIHNGIGGDMCTVSQSTGMTLYLHYEPVGINNWSVVLGVSEGEALAGTRGVVKILYLMSVIVGAILLSYLAYISWYLISARRGVYRMSITDQGTGLMNRVAYEKCLRKSDQRVIAPAPAFISTRTACTRSTTSAVTRRATSCCARSQSVCGSSSRGTISTASAATSSSCFPRRRQRRNTRRGCGRFLKALPRRVTASPTASPSARRQTG